MIYRKLVALSIAAAVATAAAPVSADEHDLALRLESFSARDYPDVSLIVSLPPRLSGSSLEDSAFAVTENGKPVAVEVGRVPTDGLDVVLLIDTSGSMSGSALTNAKEAGAAFAEKMPAEVEVAVVAFGESAEVVGSFTTDRGETVQAIADLTARGETALYDGLVAATELFRGDVSNRRVVVMLSDGGDTISAGTLEDAIVSLLVTEARFYAVELQTAENDHEALARLGSATDGRVVPANDPQALDGIFDEIAAAIVSQYELSFEASAHSATELGVTITAAGVTAALVSNVQMPPAPVPQTPVSEPGPPAVLPEAAPSEASPPQRLPLVEVPLGWLASRQALLIGLVATFVALLGLSSYLARGQSRVRLAAADVTARMRTRQKGDGSMLTGLTTRVTQLAERAMEPKGRKGQLDRSLEAAGISLRSGELILSVLAFGFAAFVVGYLLGSPTTGIALAVGVALVTPLTISRKVTKRRAAFADQLFATMQLMSGSLRAGFGLMQAIDVVGEESPSPTEEEFRRVKVETHLGRDLDDALAAMAERVGSDDFELLVEAIQIHREVGGDLSKIVDSVAETVRERHRLKGQIRALSAEGRFSAGVLTILPLAMGAFLFVNNPDYVGELTGITGGQITLAAAGLLMVLGIIWLRRLSRLDF